MSLYQDSLALVKANNPELSDKDLRLIVTANLLETAESVDNAILEALWESYKNGDYLSYETLVDFVLEVYAGKRDDSTLRKYVSIIQNVLRPVEILRFDGKLTSVDTPTGTVEISVDKILEEKGLISKLAIAANGISNLGLREMPLPETEREQFEQEYYSTSVPQAPEVVKIVENMFIQKTRDDFKNYMNEGGYTTPKLVLYVHQGSDSLTIQNLTAEQKKYILKRLKAIGAVEDV